MQHHLGSIAFCRRDFRRRRILRHADHRADSVDLRRQRDALRMITRRRAHHAALLLLLGHQRELVERSADLVRPDALKHFRLEPHVEAGALAELTRRQQRRVLDVLADARADGFEIIKSQREHTRNFKFQISN